MKPSLFHEIRSLPPLPEEIVSALKAEKQGSLEAPEVERGIHQKENTPRISLIIPAKNSQHSLPKTVRDAHQFFSERYGSSFEIILVPNPAPDDPQDESTQVAYTLQKEFPQVRVAPHGAPRGKGAALRTGFIASRGQWIFFTDSDLPYDLSFFDQAAEKLKRGFHLVHGNRRKAESRFSIPVKLLSIAYSRHRLGLWFNQIVRWWLPIETTDTQAGIKAMTRTLAREFFLRQACPGFLFDLELFLTARGAHLPVTELPVTLYLNSEKSTVRILRECILVLSWLVKIKWRERGGDYGFRRRNQILKRYSKTPWGTRIFLALRWWLTPYSQMSLHLPPSGTILDLGCGHGLFALAASLQFPQRTLLGLDHDAERIRCASLAAEDLRQIRWTQGDLTHLPAAAESFSGIAMIDVLHYFQPQEQLALMRLAYKKLDSEGVLIFREVNPSGGFISYWNRIYEAIATRIGFTQANEENLHFRSQEDWERAAESAGFEVSSERCSSVLFADILYVCRKPKTEPMNASS